MLDLGSDWSRSFGQIQDLNYNYALCCGITTFTMQRHFEEHLQIYDLRLVVEEVLRYHDYLLQLFLSCDLSLSFIGLPPPQSTSFLQWHFEEHLQAYKSLQQLSPLQSL